MDFVVCRGISLIRVSFVVPVTLSFAEGLLEFDWMYVVNRQCESREDHRKKQAERDEEYLSTKLLHKEQFFFATESTNEGEEKQVPDEHLS